MRIVYGLEHLELPCEPAVVTIGNFDGMHLGHRKIIGRVISLAEERGLLSVVLTFEYHPLRLLAPQRAPEVLMPIQARLDAMQELGVQLAVVANCTREFLSMDPDTFLRDLLIPHFQLKVIVEGPNFCFGKDRAGTIDFLIDRSRKLGFEAIRVEPVEVDLPGRGKHMLSSSLVRELLHKGQVDLAEICLGRPYEIQGKVIPGSGLGKSLGFPTANLETGEQMLPADGIYAGWVRMDNRSYPAAIVIGPAPTVDRYQTAVEAFVIDFEGDLYGRELALSLIKWLRVPKKFDDLAALTEQINRDVELARQVLAARENTISRLPTK